MKKENPDKQIAELLDDIQKTLFQAQNKLEVLTDLLIIQSRPVRPGPGKNVRYKMRRENPISAKNKQHKAKD
ncbi:MAG TPA: hypothetical protein PKJ37_02365 [Acidobacteriota bacterium]|nr:hypothetical protein [Acidobacteriota bacterium]